MQISIPRFDRAQVLVVGDLMLDRYWHGPTSRISPEAPVPVVKVEGVEDRIGGAGNVALNIAALGAGASVVGIVGRDEAADALKTRLDSAGIYADFHVAENKPTITKLRVISRQQQLLRLDFEEFFDASDADSGCAVAERGRTDSFRLCQGCAAESATVDPGSKGGSCTGVDRPQGDRFSALPGRHPADAQPH